jgi:thiamine-phosphate pyrophosphorylase
VRRQIREALAVAADYDCQMIVNDYWREAIAARSGVAASGTARSGRGPTARRFARRGLKLGISTHSPQELLNALDATPDYVALGPIYETTLKKMPWSPQGLERIGEWKARFACPLVAIGGITLERAPAVLAAGADSIAVVSDVLRAPDPNERVRAWLALFREAVSASACHRLLQTLPDDDRSRFSPLSTVTSE